MRILVIHGPNINMLGWREPEIYGDITLDEVNSLIKDETDSLGLDVRFFQSNIEGEIVTEIQNALGNKHGIIINPAAYTHTSVAIRDAIAAVGLPTVEVHLSNVFKREPFRHLSYVSPVALGIIAGLGVEGYVLAVRGLAKYLSETVSE